jgi:hypothetical protein
VGLRFGHMDAFSDIKKARNRVGDLAEKLAIDLDEK